MNILAIDIGTQTGWALGTRDGKVRSGTKSFTAGKHDGPGQRWLKFRAFLTETGRSAGEIQAVYYEDVKNHAGVIASHIYGGFLAHLETWCELNRVVLVPVGVGTIKKAWTGKGNADKDMMIAAAVAKGFRPKDSNEADALAILSLARLIEAGDYVAPVKVKKPRKTPSFFAEAA